MNRLYFFVSGYRANQQGVALIQALLISVIISLLAIRFTYTSQYQIDTSASMNHRLNAKLMLQSAQNGLIYALATNEVPSTNIFNRFNRQALNGWGEPFVIHQLDGYTVTGVIQNSTGLLSQRYVKTAPWRTVLRTLGMNDSEIDQVTGSIDDWQDKDSNGWRLGQTEPSTLPSGMPYKNQPIQLFQEFSFIFPQGRIDSILLNNITTTFATPGVNVMVAPNRLLRLLLMPSIAEDFILRRELGQLTQDDALLLLGSQYNEFDYIFNTGNKYRIIVRVEKGDIVMEETMELELDPLQQKPVLVYSKRANFY